MAKSQCNLTDFLYCKILFLIAACFRRFHTIRKLIKEKSCTKKLSSHELTYIMNMCNNISFYTFWEINKGILKKHLFYTVTVNSFLLLHLNCYLLAFLERSWGTVIKIVMDFTQFQILYFHYPIVA